MSTATQPTVKRIMDNVVVLDLIFHKPGITKSGDMGLVETESKKEMLSLTKLIIESKEYLEVLNHTYTVRTWLTSRTVPSPLKRGTYLVPVKSVEMISEFINKAETKYKELVEKFLDVYPTAVENAKEDLKDQFNPSNYLTVDQLRSAFWVERRFIDFGIPTEEKIGAELWKQEKVRAEQTWGKAVEVIQAALRTSFRDLVTTLADRLEPKADGSRKAFRDATVNHILEFIDLFKARNVTDDAELDGLVAQANEVLNGRKPEDIRGSDAVRGEILGEMGRVKMALDQLIETAPRRRISFDD